MKFEIPEKHHVWLLSTLWLVLLSLTATACGSFATPEPYVSVSAQQTAEWHYNQAMLLNVTPSPFRAEEELYTALELNPDQAKYYFALGMTGFYRRAPSIAISNFNSALELDPMYVEAYLWRGHSEYELLEDEMAAFNSYSEVIERGVYSAIAYGRIAQIYLNRGDPDKALAAYTDYIQHDPDTMELRPNRAQLYLEQKRYAEAEIDARLLTEDPYTGQHSESWLMLGQALTGQGRDAEALEAYQRHIELAGDKADPLALDFVSTYTNLH